MKNIFTLLAAVLLTATTYAQIGINNENPDASAALDITSTTGGLLVPRMTETQRDAISPAATGLMIYQTDGTAGFYYYNGSSWDTYYSKNEVDTILTNLQNHVNQFTPKVGDRYQGGMIFYIYQSGDLGYVDGETHGLIAALEDQASTIQWYNGYNIVTGVTSDGIGNGRPNTDYIIAAQGEVQTNYAAGLAKAYSGGGYTDWFLPCFKELEKMAASHGIITTTALANGGGSFEYYPKKYWSSNEASIGMASAISFSGYTYLVSKNANLAVRAVRYF